MSEKKDQKTMLQFEPKEVVVISTEMKQLPFRSAVHWNQEYVQNYKDFVKVLAKYVPIPGKQLPPDFDDSKRLIVVDSLTRMVSLMSDYLKTERAIGGYAFWEKYAEHIKHRLMQTMFTNKWLVWLAIDDIETDAEGETYKTVKLKGKEMKGTVESYFTIVLWTSVAKGESTSSLRYHFITNSDGANKAKTPLGMFNEDRIPNDLSYVLQKISDYYGFDPDDFNAKRPNILIVGSSGSGKSTSLRNLIKLPE